MRKIKWCWWPRSWLNIGTKKSGVIWTILNGGKITLENGYIRHVIFIFCYIHVIDTLMFTSNNKFCLVATIIMHSLCRVQISSQNWILTIVFQISFPMLFNVVLRICCRAVNNIFEFFLFCFVLLGVKNLTYWLSIRKHVN